MKRQTANVSRWSASSPARMGELELCLMGQPAALASRHHAGPAGSAGSLDPASTGGLPLLAQSLPLAGSRPLGLAAQRMQAAARLAQRGVRSGVGPGMGPSTGQAVRAALGCGPPPAPSPSLAWARPASAHSIGSASAQPGGSAVGDDAARADTSAARALSQALSIACSASAAAACAAADATALEAAATANASTIPGAPADAPATWRAASVVARAAAHASAEAARRAHARVAALRAQAAHTEPAHAAARAAAVPAQVGPTSIRAAAAAAAAVACTARAAGTGCGAGRPSSSSDLPRKSSAGKLAAPARLPGEGIDTSPTSSDAGSSEQEGKPAVGLEAHLSRTRQEAPLSPKVPSRCADLYAHPCTGASLCDSLPPAAAAAASPHAASLAVGASSMSRSLPLLGNSGRVQGVSSRGGSRGGSGGGSGGSSGRGSDSCATCHPDHADACEGAAQGEDRREKEESAAAAARALMRVREKKKAERAAAAAAEVGTSEETVLARAVAAQQKEDREVERAQIYAINRLVAAYQESQFAALAQGRAAEARAVAQRHEVEVEARREAAAGAAAAAHQRIRARAVEIQREARELQAREQEAAEAKRQAGRVKDTEGGEAKRQAQRQAAGRAKDTEGRQERRAQVDVVSEALANHEALESRFGVPGGLSADAASGPAARSAAAVRSVRSVYGGGLIDRRGAEVVAALSPCKTSRRNPLTGLDDDTEQVAGRGPSLLVPSALSSAVEAAALRVLTVAAAQRVAVKSREVATAQRRETAREKGEEKEIFRAQVYALNRLMRAREEESFRRFKARVEEVSVARVDGSGGGRAEETALVAVDRDTGGDGVAGGTAADDAEGNPPFTIKRRRRRKSK